MSREEQKVLDSWHTNAAPWTDAIRQQQIESRRLVTDQAVIDAVMSRAPHTALDIGCGEGWLTRALRERGVDARGVDAVPALIEQARAADPSADTGRYRVATYEEMVSGSPDAPVDVAVANFALIGAESVDSLVAATPRLLAPGGALVIQTLHPLVAGGELPYKEGWRPGTWAGFNPAFTDPPPWYFRPLEAWVRLIVYSGMRLVELREPVRPDTGRPASVIFIAERSR